MRRIEELQKQWQDRGRFRGLHASMSLEKDGLVLGAKTVLAKRNHDGALVLDGAEAPLLTLLAVAYGQPIDAAVLGKIRGASKHAKAGDECRAAMHIALAGLPILPDPVDAARRLFIAEGLLANGVTPRDIFTALDFDSAPLDELEKYNSNKSRNPAGNGRASGEWTIGGALFCERGCCGRRAVGRRPICNSNSRASGANGCAIVGARSKSASRVAPPVAFLSALFDSSDLGGPRVEGAIRDFPDLGYSRQQDETALHIVSLADGHTILTIYPGGGGTFVDPESGVVAHMEGDELVIGPPATAVPQAKERTDEPELCPEPPGPDLPGMIGPRGVRSKAYEDYMKALVNPENPTPHGYGYQLPNPEQGQKLVYYDDCHHPTGTMIDYKSTGFAKAILGDVEPMMKSYAAKWTRQANNQIDASGGRNVVWFFAELPALKYARKVFDSPGNEKLRRIKLFHAAWPDGDKWKRRE